MGVWEGVGAEGEDGGEEMGTEVLEKGIEEGEFGFEIGTRPLSVPIVMVRLSSYARVLLAKSGRAIAFTVCTVPCEYAPRL